jgi:hypothetical protein
MFVVLSDISFTPNAQLGRNIYTFSATATEIDEAIGKNYIKHFDTIQEEGDYILTRVYSPWAHYNVEENAFTPWESVTTNSGEVVDLDAELTVASTLYVSATSLGKIADVEVIE